MPSWPTIALSLATVDRLAAKLPSLKPSLPLHKVLPYRASVFFNFAGNLTRPDVTWNKPLMDHRPSHATRSDMETSVTNLPLGFPTFSYGMNVCLADLCLHESQHRLADQYGPVYTTLSTHSVLTLLNMRTALILTGTIFLMPLLQHMILISSIIYHSQLYMHRRYRLTSLRSFYRRAFSTRANRIRIILQVILLYIFFFARTRTHH
jgi:hypothetical protein